MGGGHSLVATTQWYLQGSKHYGRQGFAEASAKWCVQPPTSPGRTPLSRPSPPPSLVGARAHSTPPPPPPPPRRRPEDMSSDLSGQVHVITGANAGLGYAAAKGLASRKAEVHMLCRSAERGRAAVASIIEATGNPAVHLHVVDVSDTSAVKAFASTWLSSGRPITSLVNNAGVLPAKYEETQGGLEVSMATALAQSYLLTGMLMPALAAGGRAGAGSGPNKPSPSRVIHVSSGGGLTVKGHPGDLYWTSKPKEAYNGTLQYAYAKRAQMMLTEAWAEKARAAGLSTTVVSHCMHPGWAETPGVTTSLKDFAEKQKGKLRSPEEGADTIVWLASTSDAGVTGTSGRLWFDRAPAAYHFPLAGTTSSKEEVAQLWAACGKDFGWVWDPKAGGGGKA